MQYSFYMLICFFFFKQKTAYEMRISDWSSDVCSSDLLSRLKEGCVTQLRATGDGNGEPEPDDSSIERIAWRCFGEITVPRLAAPLAANHSPADRKSVV